MKTKYVAFFFLFGVVGYLRERFFEHTNMIMYGKYWHKDEYAIAHIKMPAIMTPLNNLSYSTLYYSKYLFTAISVAIFLAISYLALKKLTQNKNILKFLVWSYLLLLILAGISMIIGYLMSGTLKNDEYTLSRSLLGVAQSPIICLILLAAEKLYSKTKL